MAGRTSLMADKALNLYRGIAATPVTSMWVTLFTTNPTADHPTSHGAVEWGPSRVRIFPTSAAGSPFWAAPFDLSATERAISNGGNVGWSSITLTVSPSTVRGVGFFDAQTGGNLLTWDELLEDVVVADGEDHVFGTGALRIRGD